MTELTAASEPGVVEWLLDPTFPAVRRLTLVRLLGRRVDDPEIGTLEARLADDPWVAPLLAGEWRTGVRGRARVHPYKKWGGAHWRLVALAELGVTRETPGDADAIAEAFDQVAAWLLNPRHIDAVPKIEGRYRRCGSQEGNALWAACRIGVGTEAQRDELAANLLRWQWPDGGWNCDIKPGAHHSSFNESWVPLRALVAYRHLVGGNQELEGAIAAAAEFFLRHRVVESERTGAPANEHIAWLRWPPYWHYGLMPGLRTLAEAGHLQDPRVAPAIDRLRAARDTDGIWHANGRWWNRPGRAGANTEIVHWGEEGEARMLTLHALEVLAAAG